MRPGIVRDYGLTAIALVLLWAAYVHVFHVSKFLLPTPLHVAAAMAMLARSGQLLIAVGQTLETIMAGFALGAAGGLLLGVVLDQWPAAQDALADILVFVQTAPKIALAPLFILWFGLGFVSKLVLVVSLVFFPVLVATLLGLRLVPEEYRLLAQLFALSRYRALREVLLPLSLPMFFDGLKIALVQAVIGAIIAEWMSGHSGLGYLLVWGDTTFHTGVLLAAIVLTVALGILLNGGLEWIEARSLRWHHSRADNPKP